MPVNGKRYFFLGLGAAVLLILVTAFTGLPGNGSTAAAEPEAEVALPDSGRSDHAEPASYPSPQDLSRSFRSVAEQVLPVVVEINVVEVVRQNIPRLQSPFDFFFAPPGQDQPRLEEREFERPGLGSGVIVDRSGDTVYVLTNAHVVGEADRISIRLHDKREFEGRAVGRDPRTDLALVAFETSEPVPVARLGDSDGLHIGDWVLAVGNPFGFESTVTAGIISAVRREAAGRGAIASYTDYIQTDAAINPGNSGGALVNMEGEIVGINTWIASRGGGSVGLGFAIPVNNARRVIRDFLEKGRVTYGWLGVSIRDMNGDLPEEFVRELNPEGVPGAFVVNVHLDSPASESGIRPGDLITRVGEREIRDSAQLTREVGSIAPGARTQFTLLREGRTVRLPVTLAERAPEEELRDNSRLWPGMMVTVLTGEIREQLDLPEGQSGVVATGVLEGTPAAVAGLRNGDLITRVNTEPVRTVQDFYRLIGDDRSEELHFRVRRQNREFIIGLVR
ncbi:MAG: Do family serine endopeptidase [Spirochaetaceae bacterium]|nr:MAG: Do family serine endopeptidase [Spirochaetaceae bacterium]